MLPVFAEIAGAGTVENQRMVHDVEFQHVANHVLDILNPWVTELHHLVAIRTDEVVVLTVTVRFLVLGQVTAKLVFGNQIAVDQYIERIINRSSAYAIILVFHRDVQLVHVKVVFPVVDLFQNSESFGCFPQPLVF